MTEIIAMIASLIIAGYFTFFNDSLLAWQEIILGAILTTIIWVVSVFFTRTTSDEVLLSFYKKIKPQGPGWQHVRDMAKKNNIDLPEVGTNLPFEILCVLIGAISVYSMLFSVGNIIYGQTGLGLMLAGIAGFGTFLLIRLWSSMNKVS